MTFLIGRVRAGAFFVVVQGSACCDWCVCVRVRVRVVHGVCCMCGVCVWCAVCAVCCVCGACVCMRVRCLAVAIVAIVRERANFEL